MFYLRNVSPFLSSVLSRSVHLHAHCNTVTPMEYPCKYLSLYILCFLTIVQISSAFIVAL